MSEYKTVTGIMSIVSAGPGYEYYIDEGDKITEVRFSEQGMTMIPVPVGPTISLVVYDDDDDSVYDVIDSPLSEAMKVVQ